MLLVHIRVQGEGEAKLPSFLTYRLISVPDTNREDKAVYTEAQPSQLKSQKYRPILSHLVLRVAQAFDIYERAEMNQAEIYGAASSRSQKCLLWNRCLVYLDPKHPFLYQTPRNTQKVAYVLDATETAGQSSRPRVSVY